MKQKYITIIIILLYALTSCNDEQLFDDRYIGENCTHLSFNVTNNILVETETRAIEDDLYNRLGLIDLHLLVFNKEKVFKGCEKVDFKIVKFNADNTAQFPTLLDIKDEDILILLANTLIETIPDGITYENINRLFMPKRWKIIDDKTTDANNGLPMYAKIDAWKGSDKQTFILKKSATKFNLFVSSISSGDAFGKWTVANTPLFGNIFYDDEKAPIQVAEGLQKDDFYITKNVGQNIEVALSNNTNGLRTHCYAPAYPSATTAKLQTGVNQNEFHKDRLCLLLWVTDRLATGGNGQYYRIDIAKPNTNGLGYTWIDILPNHTYSIRLHSINGKGYLTKEEALNSPPGNLTYDIIVEGDDDNVTVSTGQYALELEYDKLIAYAPLNAEFTINARAIIPSGSGMPHTNKITSKEFKINYNDTTLTGEQQVIRFQNKELEVLYEKTRTGKITFNLGTISKTIEVEINKSHIDAHPERATVTGDFSNIEWRECDEGITYTASRERVDISCGDNTTPEAWYNHNTRTWSTASDDEAEPVFRLKTLTGYEKTPIGNKRTKLIIAQSAPTYIGWMGGSRHQGRRRFVIENTQEMDGSIPKLYYWAAADYWARIYIGKENNDLTLGDKNTAYLMNDRWDAYPAAFACWKKQDKNGDGYISDWEKDENPWYLPSHHQLMQIRNVYSYIAKPFMEDRYYISSTEYREEKSADVSKKYSYHLSILSTGMMHYVPKYDSQNGTNFEYDVRCVKNIK